MCVCVYFLLVVFVAWLLCCVRVGEGGVCEWWCDEGGGHARRRVPLFNYAICHMDA